MSPISRPSESHQLSRLPVDGLLAFTNNARCSAALPLQLSALTATPPTFLLAATPADAFTLPTYAVTKKSMTTLLPASLQKTLRDIAERSNQRGASVRAILLSTTEGVPLGRVIADASLNEGGLASIESVWAPASAPASVLGLDKVKQVTAIYDHGTLVHIYEASMVSFLARSMRFAARVFDDDNRWPPAVLIFSHRIRFWRFSTVSCAGGDDLMRCAIESRSSAINGYPPFEASAGAVVQRAGQFSAARNEQFVPSCYLLPVDVYAIEIR